ncbi:hypothetical protein OAO18_08760 [Francisellaceae bacterium]|nr:hypothetical protein [Francisellaceae bacterium]
MSSSEQTLNTINQLAQDIFSAFKLHAYCHIVKSDRQIESYYILLNVDGMQPVMLRSFTAQEMLMKLSLLKEALQDLPETTTENFMPLILEHLVEKEKKFKELALILFELEINFQLFSRILAEKRQDNSSSDTTH